MEGTFELNKKGYYTPKTVSGNDFINTKSADQDKAKYGLTYSVSFSGDAETYLWTAKTEPEVGRKYYGHIQETSGKMYRIKVDKLEDGNYSTGPSISHKAPYKDNSKDITLGLVYKTVVAVQGIASTPNEINELKKTIKLHAQMLYELSAEFSGSQSEESKPTLTPPNVIKKPNPQAAAPSLSEAWKNTVGPPPTDGDEPYLSGDDDR